MKHRATLFRVLDLNIWVRYKWITCEGYPITLSNPLVSYLITFSGNTAAETPAKFKSDLINVTSHLVALRLHKLCRAACWISKRYQIFNIKSRGFEGLRDLTRFITAEWRVILDRFTVIGLPHWQPKDIFRPGVIWDELVQCWRK